MPKSLAAKFTTTAIMGSFLLPHPVVSPKNRGYILLDPSNSVNALENSIIHC